MLNQIFDNSVLNANGSHVGPILAIDERSYYDVPPCKMILLSLLLLLSLTGQSFS